MRSQILAAVGLAAGAYAAGCMSADDAALVAANFQHLIDEPFSEELATSALTPDFVDYASGVNTLINQGCAAPLDLTAATFTSRDAFIAGQSSQAPIPFEILNLWNNCDNVMLRWRTHDLGPTQPPETVTGMVVIETTESGDDTNPWQIQTVYSEFNSGAWLYDLGIFVPTCSATKRSLRL